MLSTTVGGVWVLQALLGVESMPAALRLKPFIPSAHGEGIVALEPKFQRHDHVALGGYRGQRAVRREFKTQPVVGDDAAIPDQLCHTHSP